ncbi:MAG: hypothetical protein ACKVIK_13110 [Rhodospirillales bacterium]
MARSDKISFDDIRYLTELSELDTVLIMKKS